MLPSCLGQDLETKLEIFFRLGRPGLFDGFAGVRDSVIVQIRVGDPEMRPRWNIRIRGQFLAQFQGAHVRRILIAHAAGVEGFIWNRQREFAQVFCSAANLKSVFSAPIFRFKAHVLHQNIMAHVLPGRRPG